jgi:hypothetical protein
LLPACLATTYYLLTYGCYPVGSRYLSRQAGRQAGTAVWQRTRRLAGPTRSGRPHTHTHTLSVSK